MPLHATVLPHRRQAIVFHSTGVPSQFTYIFGIAVELVSRKALGPNVDIYFMTDDTRKELIENTKDLHFLSLGPLEEVQADLSTTMSNARSGPRDAWQLASITKNFWRDPEIIMNCISRCHEHLKRVKPMLVVLDQFSRALDSAMTLRIPYLMCGNEVIPSSKPTDRSALQTLFTVPSIATGYFGPMSWGQTFRNVNLIVRYLSYLVMDPRIRKQAKDRRAMLNEPNLPFATLDRNFGADLEAGEIWAMPKSVLHPHAEYKTVFPVGPTFAAQFDEKHETNLAGWLDEAPVVYINMGTLFQYTDADLHVFASALRDLTAPTSSRTTPLATHNRHRFLWKLPRKYRERLAELYPTFLSQTETYGRVRIESWIDYPHAVLQHRNVLAFMHHGGANSFIESGWCGVPQVILPQWADCYDTAAQVVVHGLGVTNAEDPNVPYLSVPAVTTLINTILAADPSSTPAYASSIPELEKLGQPQRGYAWYKKNAEEFAEECRLAGGATRAAEIIETMYAKELTEWDGPEPISAA